MTGPTSGHRHARPDELDRSRLRAGARYFLADRVLRARFAFLLPVFTARFTDIPEERLRFDGRRRDVTFAAFLPRPGLVAFFAAGPDSVPTAAMAAIGIASPGAGAGA